MQKATSALPVADVVVVAADGAVVAETVRHVMVEMVALPLAALPLAALPLVAVGNNRARRPVRNQLQSDRCN